MQRRLLILILFACGFMVGAAMMNASAKNTDNPDKPINAMTPAELFDNPGLRALAEAAQNGNVRKIDALIAKGVNVNGTGKYGITPLFSAAQVQNKKGFKALLEHGANPNVVGSDGYTTLNFIARLSDPYFLKLALKHGADPNLVEPATGKTPIFLAVSPYAQGNLSILINAGANLNYKIPSTGWTPMMQAVIFGQFDTVYKLLKAGADYKIKDSSGWDLENYIDARATAGPEKRWRDKVIEYLKQHHAWHERGSSGTTSAEEAGAGSASAPTITNYEAPGNLKSTHRIECVASGEVTNQDTPADLFPAIALCLRKDEYQRAVFLYALGGAYGYFDSLRVADSTAHNAVAALQSRLIDAVPEAQRKRFAQTLTATTQNTEKLRALCDQVKKVGPPAYYPRYMVQHGMQAFTGEEDSKGLVPDFDAEKGWAKALSSFLHCPEA